MLWSSPLERSVISIPKLAWYMVVSLLLGGGIVHADELPTDEKERQEFCKAVDHFNLYMEPANSANLQHDYDKAIELYLKAADSLKKRKFRTGNLDWQRTGIITDALRSAGEMAMSKGDFDQAARVFLYCDHECPAGICGPNMSDAARAFMLGKHFDKAVEIYQKQIDSPGQATRYSPGIIALGYAAQDPHVNLARVYEAQGKTQLAEETLQSFLNKMIAENKVGRKRVAMQGLIDFYQRTGRPELAKKEDEKLHDKHCPVCKSDTMVVPIRYGLPYPLVLSNFDETKVKLGGCTSNEDSPNWYCRTDKTRF